MIGFAIGLCAFLVVCLVFAVSSYADLKRKYLNAVAKAQGTESANQHVKAELAVLRSYWNEAQNSWDKAQDALNDLKQALTSGEGL